MAVRGRGVERRIQEGTWFELRAGAGGVFYIHWSECRRSKRESTRTKELAAASAFFDEWLTLRRTPGEGGSVLTCSDIFDLKYNGEGRPATAWKNLAVTFADLRPPEVTQKVIDGYVAARGAGRIGTRRARPATVRLELAYLYASWAYAAKPSVRALQKADLPALDPLPEDSPPRERYLTEAEVKRLFAAAAGDPGELFLWLALNTAGRKTSITDLRWETGQIDFSAANGVGVVHLNPEGRAQTRKRRASVEMSPQLRTVLLRARQERGSVVGLDGRQAYEAVKRIAARAELAKVSPHVLRHTAATQLAKRGVPLWIIANLLGNTLAQVEKAYAKWAPGFGTAAVGHLGAMVPLALVAGEG